MSSYDRRHAVHYHYIFQNDIDLNVANEILDVLSNAPETFISKHCIVSNSEIIEQYFLDLKTSVVAQNIEREYRQDKNAEFAKAEEIEIENEKLNMIKDKFENIFTIAGKNQFPFTFEHLLQLANEDQPQLDVAPMILRTESVTQLFQLFSPSWEMKKERNPDQDLNQEITISFNPR